MFLLRYSIKYHFLFTSRAFRLPHFLHLSLSHSSQAHRPCTPFSLQLHPNPLCFSNTPTSLSPTNPCCFTFSPLSNLVLSTLSPHRPLLYLPPKCSRQEIDLAIIVFVAAVNDTVSISSQLNPIRA
jgi:hypothetical protein